MALFCFLRLRMNLNLNRCQEHCQTRKIYEVTVGAFEQPETTVTTIYIIGATNAPRAPDRKEASCEDEMAEHLADRGRTTSRRQL